MSQADNQSSVIKGVTESALEDLNVPNADLIKGGPETVHLYLKSSGEDIQGESAMAPNLSGFRLN